MAAKTGAVAIIPAATHMAVRLSGRIPDRFLKRKCCFMIRIKIRIRLVKNIKIN